MDNDSTEQQSLGGESSSKILSMQGTTPPTEVPGYRLEKFLGAGAFGQVWTGIDLNTGRAVAIKFCLHRRGVNWSLLSHEVKNLVQLSADRYVVQVLEVGWDSEPPFYVMELVPGSLEDMLRVRGKLPRSEAVDLFKKICVGLNHCHGKGVLHCDIKPANILLDEDNEPRLADFGQSRMTHDQTPALGTLFYMAPEQADLESTPDASWDVYAVGAILYRMLSGQLPYRDNTIMDHIDTAGSLPKRLARYREAISDSSAPPHTQLNNLGLDRALIKIVARCLAVDSDKRYANVQQILDDLKRRETAIAKRPLMLLGIVGPILLLLATSVFATSTIVQATESTMMALKDEASGSNRLAARFAARTLESEIAKYFELARSESSNESFMEQVKQTLDAAEVQSALRDISQKGSAVKVDEFSKARESLFAAKPKQELDQLLASRLQRYVGEQASVNQPRLASMFVTDAKGTIVSIAYDKVVQKDANSVGRNYSYRTYFHGGRNDRPRDTPIDSVQILTHTHLSAAFPSTATGLWKVAVSQPLDLDDDGDSDAVFVVTINLGDFQLQQSEAGANQIAVLVDARDGPGRGTILQHPLMDTRRVESQSSVGDVFQVPAQLMNTLSEGRDRDYRDPVSQADDGSAYAGDWLAAIQPVLLPVDDRSNRSAQQADLLVLVQYRLSKVFEPVDAMRTQLLRDGAIAILSILLVAYAMWLFARRVDVDKRLRNDTDTANGLAETLSLRK